MSEPGKTRPAGRGGVDLWVLAGRALTALLVVAVLFLLTYETLHHVVAVEPIPSTKSTTDLGLTPDVAAQHMRDALADIALAAQRARRTNLSLDAQTPDMTLPGVGVSVGTIAAYLRGILHIDAVRQVSGDFTESHGRVTLRMRVDGMLVYETPEGGVDPAQAQQELALAAGKVALEITPSLYAAYLRQRCDADEIATLRRIVATTAVDPTERGDAERLWGQIMAEAGDPVSALEHYAAARRLYDQDGAARKSAVLQNYIGQAHLQAGDAELAKAAYRQALHAGPSWPSAATAWLNLGDVLRDQDKNWPAALAAYQQALAIDPHLRYARDAEGRTYEKLASYPEAADSYRASIEDYPGDLQSYVHLSELVALQPKDFAEPAAMLHWIAGMAPVADPDFAGAP